MPTFDIEAARKDGLPDEQILQYLGKVKNFDVDSALKEGADKNQLLNYLSTNDNPIKSTQIQSIQRPQQPDFEKMIANAEKPMIDLSGGPQKDYNYFTKAELPPGNAPSWAINHPSLYTAAARTRDTISPTLQALAYTGGAALGGPMGAGIMNAQEQNLENMADVYLGRKPQPSIGENFMQAGKNFAYGTALEGLTKNINNIKDYIPEKLKNWMMLKKPTNLALEAEQQAKDIGVNMMPSDIRQSKTLAQIEGGMGRLLGSSSLMSNEDKQNIMNIIKEAKSITDASGKPIASEDLGRRIYDQVNTYLTDQTKLTSNSLENIRNGVKNIIGSSLNPVKLSETAAEGIQQANKGMYDKAQSLYAERNKLIPKEGIPLNNTLTAAEKWDNIFSKMPQTEVNKTLRNRINEIVDMSKQEIPQDTTTIESLWTKPGLQRIMPKANVDAISLLKTNINADLKNIDPSFEYGLAGIKGATKAGESLSVRAYRDLTTAIEKDINVFGRTSPAFGLANKEAIRYYGPFKRLVNHPDFMKIIKSNPEEVLSKINDVVDVRLLKQALGEDKFNELIKPAFTNKLFGTGVEAYNPDITTQAIIKYSDVIPKVYSPVEVRLMKSAIQKGTIIQDDFNNVNMKFLRSLLKAENPESTINAVFTGGRSQYALRNLRYINKIADPQLRDELKYYLSEKVLFGGQKIDPASLLTDNKAYQDFNFSILSKNIQNNESIIKEFHSPEIIDRLKRLANIGSYMQSAGKYAGRKIAETGQSYWAFAQLMGFGKELATGNIPGALGVLFGPAVATNTYLHTPMRGIIAGTSELPQWLKVGAKYGALRAGTTNMPKGSIDWNSIAPTKDIVGTSTQGR